MSVVLVDGNSIAWRAMHAGAGLQHDGASTGCSFLFLRMLRGLLADLGNVQRVTVAWDGGIPEFRRKVFPQYKAQRQTHNTEAEARERRAVFQSDANFLSLHALPLLGVQQVRVQGWEADDVLAWLLPDTQARQRVVYSGDRDLWQLIDASTFVYDPRLQTLLDLDTLPRHTQVATPQRWLLYRILTGDASDGIPGVGGVGKKRGLQLAQHPRPWPESGEKLFGTDWTFKRLFPAYRNYQLMSLAYARDELAKTLIALRATPSWRPAQRQLDKARAAVDSRGMASLVETWPEWTKPFALLEG